MKNIICIACCFFALATWSQLTVNVKNVPSSNGKILLGIYNSASSFPKQDGTYKNVVVKAVKGTTKIVVNNLPKGNYAIALYHDANSNSVMDKNFFGVPTEYYGFSNDARETFSAPSFESAKIVYTGKMTTSITIE
ncbi:MAG: DUF2141 domain-containing protein [Lishizhenia sp.]